MDVPPFNTIFRTDSHRVLGTIFVFLVWWIPVAWFIFLNTGLNKLLIWVIQPLSRSPIFLMQRYAAIRIVCNLVPSLFLEFNITAGNSNPMSLSEVAKDHTFFIQVEVQIFW